MTDLARAALAVNLEYLALGNERFQAAGATFIRNRAAFQTFHANYITGVTASTPEEVDWLLARPEQEFAGISYRRFALDFSTPPSFEARLVLEGYQWGEELFLLLEGDLVGTPKPCDIRLATDDDAWAACARLWEVDRREDSESTASRSYSEEGARARMRLKRAKSPPVRCWLAYVNGEPVAYCSSWAGVDGFGLVEDLLTHPDFRHRGLATALIHRCVADCREGGAGPVVIGADASDTPKLMYAAMGFRPLAVTWEYIKDVHL